MVYLKSKQQVIYILGIAVVLLMATNIWTAVTWKRSFQVVKSEYPLLDPARGIHRQEDLIINVQPLRDYLNGKYEADPNISIYFEYLPTGSNIAISKDAEFYSASLLKVPVAMAVAKKIEKGGWKWSNELVLLPADKDVRFGTLHKEKSNSTYTIEDLARRSLADSDNTAHFILVRNLEASEVEDVYDHMGLKGFLNTDGKLSAKRYSVILRALYNSSYLTENNSQKLLSFLTKSPFNDFLQSALPPDITFAHKIGIAEKENIFLDSGIVYAKNRPYILTVMLKIKEAEKAKETMKDISEKVYAYVDGYEEKVIND